MANKTSFQQVEDSTMTTGNMSSMELTTRIQTNETIRQVQLGLRLSTYVKFGYYAVAILLNVFTVVLVQKRLASKKGFKIYVQHMCLTYICFLCVHILLIHVLTWNRVSHNVECYVYFYCIVFFYYLLTFQVTILSIDRWAAVRLKLRYQMMSGHRVTTCMVGIIWISSLVLTACTLVGGFESHRPCKFTFILNTKGIFIFAVLINVCIVVNIATSISVARTLRISRVAPATTSISVNKNVSNTNRFVIGYSSFVQRLVHRFRNCCRQKGIQGDEICGCCNLRPPAEHSHMRELSVSSSDIHFIAANDLDVDISTSVTTIPPRSKGPSTEFQDIESDATASSHDVPVFTVHGGKYRQANSDKSNSTEIADAQKSDYSPWRRISGVVDTKQTTPMYGDLSVIQDHREVQIVYISTPNLRHFKRSHSVIEFHEKSYGNGCKSDKPESQIRVFLDSVSDNKCLPWPLRKTQSDTNCRRYLHTSWRSAYLTNSERYRPHYKPPLCEIVYPDDGNKSSESKSSSKIRHSRTSLFYHNPDYSQNGTTNKEGDVSSSFETVTNHVRRPINGDSLFPGRIFTGNRTFCSTNILTLAGPQTVSSILTQKCQASKVQTSTICEPSDKLYQDKSESRFDGETSRYQKVSRKHSIIEINSMSNACTCIKRNSGSLAHDKLRDRNSNITRNNNKERLTVTANSESWSKKLQPTNKLNSLMKLNHRQIDESRPCSSQCTSERLTQVIPGTENIGTSTSFLRESISSKSMTSVPPQHVRVVATKSGQPMSDVARTSSYYQCYMKDRHSIASSYSPAEMPKLIPDSKRVCGRHSSIPGNETDLRRKCLDLRRSHSESTSVADKHKTSTRSVSAATTIVPPVKSAKSSTRKAFKMFYANADLCQGVTSGGSLEKENESVSSMPLNNPNKQFQNTSSIQLFHVHKPPSSSHKSSDVGALPLLAVGRLQSTVMGPHGHKPKQSHISDAADRLSVPAPKKSGAPRKLSMNPMRKRLFMKTVIIAIWHCIGYLPVGGYFLFLSASFLCGGDGLNRNAMLDDQAVFYIIGPIVGSIINPVVYCIGFVKIFSCKRRNGNRL